MKKLFVLLSLSGAVLLNGAPTLDLYCGSTMAKAMKQISDKFEAKTGVHINIIKGGSGKLYRTILVRDSGDLYFPGSYKFIKNDKNGIFGYKKLIGYNKAIILVQKGNPKNIRNLGDFIKPNIKVVLGAKNTGSVGKITHTILKLYKDENYYEKVYAKALKAPTSLEIIQALKTKKADTSINWKAAAFMDDNANYVDFVDIPYIAPKQKLILTVVNYSKHPLLAKEFVDFAASRENKKFMKSKGF